MGDQQDRAPEIEENIGELRDRIQIAMDQGYYEQASSILKDLHPADQADIFEDLETGDQNILLSRLEPTEAADLFEELEDEDVLEIAEDLSSERLADVLDEMEPDEAADLLGDLKPQQASEVLAQMEDAEEVLPLLGYPDDTAGGLMTTWFIALRRQTTVDQAIQFLRNLSPETEVPYYLYVIDRNRRLCGVIGLRQLVTALPSAKIIDIAEPEVIQVTAGTDQEDVARLMTRYDLAVIPVVDHDQRLVGVITHDDIIDVIEDEATEDIYALANVNDADLEPDSSMWSQMRGRLPWMFVNMFTALFASWVITNFEGVITQVAILAAFQSIVAGLGGNAGTQNVAMMVRSLALGLIEQKDIGRIILKQITVGILQGLTIGLVAGIGIGMWQRNLILGLIILLAMTFNMALAGVVGTLVPFTLKFFKQDPAIASSILVTAATDSFGFFIFLSLAAWALGHLKV